MDFQIVIVALIVLAALLYVSRRVWNKTKAFSNSKKTSCGTDCGCRK